jgi:CHAT domain-containing protein
MPRNGKGSVLGGFDELEHAEEAAQAVAALFGNRARVYLGAEATEQRAKEEIPHYPLLFFYTHGVFEPANPMYSRILLTQGPGQPAMLGQGPPEDGCLEGREIVDLGLNAELAVLAACETARGDIRSGEGILGLSWALFVAGCPSSVISQWKVADESTAELMVQFYTNLQAGMSKAEALRQAQLTLRQSEKWAHPFYWSPFILVGEWR